MGEVTAVKEQPFVGNDLSAAQPRRPHANQAEQSLGEPIRLLCTTARRQLVTDVEVALLPGPIELLDCAVIEQIEEIAKPEVLFPRAIDQELRVMPRKDATCASKRQERDGHFREEAVVWMFRFVGRRGVGGDRAPWKGEADVRAKSNVQVANIRGRYRIAAPDPVLDSGKGGQAHGLEELERMRVAQQPSER